eukprot:2056774-Amphidinium_carterae.1
MISPCGFGPLAPSIFVHSTLGAVPVAACMCSSMRKHMVMNLFGVTGFALHHINLASYRPYCYRLDWEVYMLIFRDQLKNILQKQLPTKLKLK